MSSSIPIPARPSSSRPSDPGSSSSLTHFGKSLPSHAHRAFQHPSTHHRGQSSSGTQDDLATISWPPTPSVELVSRAAKKWANGHSKHTQRGAPDFRKRIPTLEPWDFSEVVTATNQVQDAFQTGQARAERPPREGVCGTYFIRRNQSKGDDVLCVFKPVDEEATDIEMSPPSISVNQSFASGIVPNEYDFSLGPAHGVASPLACSPPGSGTSFQRTGSVSSESEFDSRLIRASGFHVGEGAYKEVAAYLMDHDRFAGVPQTALAKCNFTSDIPEKNVQHSSPSRSLSSESIDDDFVSDFEFKDENTSSVNEDGSHLRTKMGAFQVYVENVGDADDFGPGVFDKDQVHRIAILDIRTLNHDRHGGNILVKQSTSGERRYDLVPIDHGYILPEFIGAVPWPVWMDWPMVREPVSNSIKNYVELLDPEAEAAILNEELEGKLRPGSLQGLKVATLLLQKGIAAGLTLYDIGLLIYSHRGEPGAMTQIEKLMVEAEEARHSRERDFLKEAMLHNPGMPEDLHHRRHQSMSMINTAEIYEDDYLVKYARRRLQDIVWGAAAFKEQHAQKKSPSRSKIPPRMARARSIPDFGIAVKPAYALVTGTDSDLVPANTPASSPTYESSRKVSAADALEAQLPTAVPQVRKAPSRQAPIKVPINDGSIRRIAIPEPRAASSSDTCHFGDDAVARVMGKDLPIRDGVDKTSGKLPPLFKSSERKSSPVGPLDMLVWAPGST